MGSFHSDDLGFIMSLSESDYQVPLLPFEASSSDFHSVQLPPPREDNQRASDFMLDFDNWTFMNHGAFGAALRTGYHRAEQWRYHLERQPLRYFDRDLLPHLAYATRRLAQFSSSTDTAATDTKSGLQVRQGLTLIQNSTAGLNTVLRGYARTYGTDNSRVLLWDTSYGSVKKLAHRVFGANRVTEIPLQEQHLDRFLTAQDPADVFLEALDHTIEAYQKANSDDPQWLLVLDHTTSNTAINMPIDTIAKHAKEKYGNDKIHVMVDGAHGLMAQDLHLDNYCPTDKNQEKPSIDFYLSNGHKWLACPRGVGMLFCPQEHLRDSVLSEPAIISHGVEESDLLSRFVWDGTRDYAAALALPAVLDFWEARDPKAVRATMRSNLFQGIRILVDHWHGGEGCHENDWLEEGVILVPPSLLSPMALVRLPKAICGSPSDVRTSNDAKRVQDFLFDNSIEVPIKCINGQLFVRVSCHIYNTMEEFDRLGKVLSTFTL